MYHPADSEYGDVVHVESPSKFYFRTKEDSRCLHKIKERLAIREHRLKPADIGDLRRGGHVLARHGGGLWRATVVSVFVVEESDGGDLFLSVHLLDRGESVSSLRRGDCLALDAALRPGQTPPLARLAHLSDVRASRHLPESWPPEAVALMRREVSAPVGIFLQRRGEPALMSDGTVSVPAELLFEESSCEAFGRTRKFLKTMSQKLRERGMAVLAHMDEDDVDEQEEFDAHTTSNFNSCEDEDEDEEEATQQEIEVSAVEEDLEEEEEVKPTVSRWLPPVIPASDRFYAKVVHVSGMGQLYVQKREDAGLVNEIRNVLTARYGSHDDGDDGGRAAAGHRRMWSRGQAAVARYKDDEYYYRAIVIQDDGPVAGDDTVVIQYADYGNIRRVPRAELRSAADFSGVPVLALRVILCGVAPPGGPTREWGPAALDWMQAKLNYQRRGSVRVTRADGASPGWDGMGVSSLPIPARVDIRLAGAGGRWTDFARVMSEAGWAVKTREVQYPSYEALLEDAFGVEGVPEEEWVNSFTAASGGAAAATTTPVSSMAPSDERKRDLVRNPFPRSSPSLFNNKILPVSVQVVNGLDEVYLHLLDHRGSSGWPRLHSALQRAAEDEPPAAAAAGDAVAVRFKGDGTFYRAYVLEVRSTRGAAASESGKKLVVFYVDVGDTDLVDMTATKRLPSSFLSTPPFALRVGLKRRPRGPSSAEAEWDETASLQDLRAQLERAQRNRMTLYFQVREGADADADGDDVGGRSRIVGDLLVKRPEGGYRPLIRC